MTNKVTIRKDGRHYYCTNREHLINDSWFHHEDLKDVKKYYVDKGYEVEIL